MSAELIESTHASQEEIAEQRQVARRVLGEGVVSHEVSPLEPVEPALDTIDAPVDAPAFGRRTMFDAEETVVRGPHHTDDFAPRRALIESDEPAEPLATVTDIATARRAVAPRRAAEANTDAGTSESAPRRAATETEVKPRRSAEAPTFSDVKAVAEKIDSEEMTGEDVKKAFRALGKATVGAAKAAPGRIGDRFRAYNQEAANNPQSLRNRIKDRAKKVLESTSGVYTAARKTARISRVVAQGGLMVAGEQIAKGAKTVGGNVANLTPVRKTAEAVRATRVFVQEAPSEAYKFGVRVVDGRVLAVKGVARSINNKRANRLENKSKKAATTAARLRAEKAAK